MNWLLRPRTLSAKQRESWSRTRARGRWFFILVNGGLGFGGYLFAFTTLLSVFIFGYKPSRFELARHAATLVLAGFIWGYVVWRRMESSFDQTE